MAVNRKMEFRLYPNATQTKALEGYCGACRWVYNRALQVRKETFEAEQRTVGFAEQCKMLTQWRKDEQSAWLAGYHTHALQLSLKRLDLAMQAFFRRVKEGGKPGFPRFKSRNRFSGFGFKEHGNGWRFEDGALRVSGIGMIRIRGKSKHMHGTPKTCEIVRRVDKWYVSITVELAELPGRERKQSQRVGIDWGVETFVTVALEDGSCHQEANPRHLQQSLDAIKQVQKELSRKKRGSKRAAKTRLRLARKHQQVANRRKDFLHKLTAWQVAHYGHIAVEKLSPLAMVKPQGGSRKRGLNRSILDASAGLYHQLLRCKAEEAGSAYVEINPLIHKPSQTCHVSGRVVKKPLSQRWHELPNGQRIGRDENAARVILQLSLGWEPPLRVEDGASAQASTIRETVSRAA